MGTVCAKNLGELQVILVCLEWNSGKTENLESS